MNEIVVSLPPDIIEWLEKKAIARKVRPSFLLAEIVQTHIDKERTAK
jgi:hypothetical protein